MIGFLIVAVICIFYIVGALLEVKWIVKPNPGHWIFNPLAGISRSVTEKQMKWIVVAIYATIFLFVLVVAIL